MIPLAVAEAIERITKAGASAKISLDRHGQYHVQEEKVKQVLVAPPNGK